MPPIKTKPSPASQSSVSRQSAALEGWTDAPSEVTRRSVMINIYGETGTGRTRLALTLPGPIALAHTSEKVDGIVQRVVKEGKVVRLLNFGTVASGTNQQIADKVGPVWTNMTRNWNDATDNWARTTIMDTETEAWELCRLAFFGELNPQGRIDNLYGPVNQRWRSVFKRHKREDYASNCHCVAISQAKDEYKDKVQNGKRVSAKTGRSIRAGQREIPIMADVIIRTDKYISKEGMIFRATVEKAWFNGHYEGTEFYNDDCRLPYILSYITDTDESEWSV